jgi:hypothetical protein
VRRAENGADCLWCGMKIGECFTSFNVPAHRKSALMAEDHIQQYFVDTLTGTIDRIGP